MNSNHASAWLTMGTPILESRCSILPRVPTTQYRLLRHAGLGCLDQLHRCRGTSFAVVVVLLPSPSIHWHSPVEIQSTSTWRLLHHVIADGQGELAMHPAHSLVATWRNCPRRGPPPYNVGSLPGRALVRHSTATARASPHLECEFLGGFGCDSIGLRDCSHRAFVLAAGNLQPSRA